MLYEAYQVPRTGIEPAHPCEYQILSLARLPVPPSGRSKIISHFVNKSLGIPTAY